MVTRPKDQLRAAITEARKDGLPADELERANDALLVLVRQRDLTELREAAASEDEELLREAIMEAMQLELPSEEIDNAQNALTALVQRRSIAHSCALENCEVFCVVSNSCQGIRWISLAATRSRFWIHRAVDPEDEP